MSPDNDILDALAHELGLFAPPLRVRALVPRRAPRGDHCAAIWVARVPDDGRVAMFFAMSLDDASAWARELLPGAPSIECARLRGELGTPLV